MSGLRSHAHAVEGHPTLPGLEKHPALVHVLTSEFQNLDPADFADIPDSYVRYTHPDSLRPSLIEVPNDGRSTVSYRAVEDNRWVRIAVTPEEFKLFSRHIPMLAKTAISDTLTARDKKLQKETHDLTARARSNEDLAAANRAAYRGIQSKRMVMENYVTESLEPRLRLIAGFQEMAQHSNLARGNHPSMSHRVELLRTKVFDDMLDAIGGQRGWSEEQAVLAKRTLQKRLYLDPNKSRRVENFAAMLDLAVEYFGHKGALVLGRIAEAKRYERQNEMVGQNVRETDLSRQKTV